MNKAEFVNAMAEQTGLSKKDSEAAINAFVNIVSDELVKKENEEAKEIQESMEVTQGKLIIGLDVNILDKDARYKIMIYNSLLGGSANSKLFQNVREKASLAYTASSSYYRFKNNIFRFGKSNKRY